MADNNYSRDDRRLHEMINPKELQEIMILNTNLRKGISLANRAVEEDSAGNYENARSLYERAAVLFLQAVQTETNPTIKEVVLKMVDEYMATADKLQKNQRCSMRVYNSMVEIETELKKNGTTKPYKPESDEKSKISLKLPTLPPLELVEEEPTTPEMIERIITPRLNKVLEERKKQPRLSVEVIKGTLEKAREEEAMNSWSGAFQANQAQRVAERERERRNRRFGVETRLSMDDLKKLNVQLMEQLGEAERRSGSFQLETKPEIRPTRNTQLFFEVLEEKPKKKEEFFEEIVKREHLEEVVETKSKKREEVEEVLEEKKPKKKEESKEQLEEKRTKKKEEIFEEKKNVREEIEEKKCFKDKIDEFLQVHQDHVNSDSDQEEAAEGSGEGQEEVKKKDLLNKIGSIVKLTRSGSSEIKKKYKHKNSSSALEKKSI